jgi:hypothetical protein
MKNKTILAFLVMMAFMILNCNAADVRPWEERDLIREIIVPQTQGKQKTFEIILDWVTTVCKNEKSDLVKSDNKIEDGYVGYGFPLKIPNGTAGDSDIFPYSVDIYARDQDAKIVFTLYPLVASGPRKGQFANRSDLKAAYAIWSTVADQIGMAVKSKNK